MEMDHDDDDNGENDTRARDMERALTAHFKAFVKLRNKTLRRNNRVPSSLRKHFARIVDTGLAITEMVCVQFMLPCDQTKEICTAIMGLAESNDEAADDEAHAEGVDAELVAELDDLRAALDGTHADLDDARAHLDEREAELERAYARLDQARATLEKKEARIASLQEEVDRERERRRDEVDRFEKKFRTERDRCDELERELWQAREMEASSSGVELQSKLASMPSPVMPAVQSETETKYAQTEMDALETDVGSDSRSIDDLMQQLVSEKEKTKHLAAELQSKTMELDRLRSTADLDEDEETLHVYQMKVKELTSSLRRRYNHVKKLEARLERRDGLIAKLRRSNEERDDLVESLKARNATLKERLAATPRNCKTAEENTDGASVASVVDESDLLSNDDAEYRNNLLPLAFDVIEKEFFGGNKRRYMNFQSTFIALLAFRKSFDSFDRIGSTKMIGKDRKCVQDQIGVIIKDLEGVRVHAFDGLKDLERTALGCLDEKDRLIHKVENLKESKKAVWWDEKTKARATRNKNSRGRNMHEYQEEAFIKLGLFKE